MKTTSNIQLPPGSGMELPPPGPPPAIQAAAGVFLARGVFSYKPLDAALDKAAEPHLRVEWVGRYRVQWVVMLVGEVKPPEIRGGVVNLPDFALCQWEAEIDGQAEAPLASDVPFGAPVSFTSTLNLTDGKAIERIVHAGPAAGPLIAQAIDESGYRALSGTGGHKDARFGFRFSDVPAPLGQKPKLEGIDGGKKKG